jgi:small GTP-binding protein
MSEGDPLVKILIIGESSVGKSCILVRYSEDRFQDSFITTVGIDFKIRPVSVNGRRLRLQIWDTAGQEKFRTITRAYYRGSHGILLVFDVTDRASFEQTQAWMNSIGEHFSDPVSVILVGNKCDLDRVVAVDEAEKFARQYGVRYFETSAKTGLNIDAVFLTMAEMIFEKMDTAKHGKDPIDVMLAGLPTARQRKEKKCCSS